MQNGLQMSIPDKTELLPASEVMFLLAQVCLYVFCLFLCELTKKVMDGFLRKF